MSSAVGSGNNPQTISRIRERDADAAGEREWRNGGRIKALIRSIPIATLTIMLTCLAVYCYQLARDEAAYENVICVQPVIEAQQYHRIFANAFFHGGFFHIFMNMLAMYQIGSSVEEQMGTLAVFGQTILFPVFVGGMYIFIEWMAATVMNDSKYYYACALGYSGVIFAFLILEVSLALMRGETTRMIFGRCPVPVMLYPIVMLLVISLILPNISFVGHLSGILIGLLYVKGMLLIFTLPRQWILALQTCLPDWLKSRPGWRSYPVEDPFSRWYPSFCRSPSFCPDAPNVDGGCMSLLNLCMQVMHLRRRQVSGIQGGGAGHALGGPRHQSRLVQPVPSAPPANALGGGAMVGPASPSMMSRGGGVAISSSSSVGGTPARPSSSPLEHDGSIGGGGGAGQGYATTDGGHYARLEGDEPIDERADDVEAQLLNARSPTAGSSAGAL